MTISVSDLIALLALLVVVLSAIAAVWWRVQVGINRVAKELADHRVEMAKELGEKAAVQVLEERFARFEERFLAEIKELRTAILDGMHQAATTRRQTR